MDRRRHNRASVDHRVGQQYSISKSCRPGQRFTRSLPQTSSEEVRKITRARQTWKHWPPLLVAIDDENEMALPAEWQAALGDVRHQSIPMSAAPAIKGLEFQHVFLFLGSQLFEELESGFEGVGKSLYTLRRRYRIPFTRAKDNIVTFVVQNP